MRKTDINRSGEMEVFVRVVEAGGFSAAAPSLQLSASAVSKMMTRLEARLGARLLSRSTRRFALTPEGAAFYERAVAILADLEDAERHASASVAAVGCIRLNTSASYSAHVLSPILPDFLDLHPGITVDVVHTDAVIDLLADRSDVAVRAGPLKSSSLVARKLGETPMIIVGSPAYLGRFGVPGRPSDLDAHNRLGFSYVRSLRGWPLKIDGQVVAVPPVGRLQVSDGEGLRRFALGGAGLARVPAFTVRDDIHAGRLVPVLEEFNPGDREEFHAVHVGQGGPLSSRVRAFLDFLAERGRVY